MKTSLIIPTLNEEESLGFVLENIPEGYIDEVLVVDGGSTDKTVEIANAFGARVIQEDRRGYGQACSTGSDHASGEILVYLDADGADDPTGIPEIIQPILDNQADMVLGSRLAGTIVSGAMPWHQNFGNWLSALLIRILYRLSITDLSPFRAVRKTKLHELGMTEMTYGWPTEMIAKAARQKWNIIEIPVNYRPRYGGHSKISGTIRGTVLATYYILSTIIKYAFNAKTQRSKGAEKRFQKISASLRLRASALKKESALIIMAKEPKVGSTKTRLCPPLSYEDAARLYEALLRDTIDSTAQLAGIDLAIAITPPESQEYFEKITPSGTLFIPVICSDIGDCLNQVLNYLLDLGYKKVIALNGDGPSLPRAYIQQAFDLLDEHDLSFGPSEDGGYYLVGMKAKHPGIYENITWSTATVLEQSLAKAQALNLSVGLTPPWYDVDTAEEIERLRSELSILAKDQLIHCRRYFDHS